MKIKDEINKLKDEGYKVHFEYIDDELIGRTGNICCIEKNGATMALGLSICSLSDNYSKKLGNLIAFGRASIALKTKESGLPITLNRDDFTYVTRSKKLCHNDVPIHSEDIIKKLKDLYSDLFGPEFHGDRHRLYSENGDKILYKVPYIYPLYLARNNDFEFKSVYCGYDEDSDVLPVREQ